MDAIDHPTRFGTTTMASFRQHRRLRLRSPHMSTRQAIMRRSRKALCTDTRHSSNAWLFNVHSCSQCSKQFVTSDGLRSHEHSHSLPFRCADCDAGFSTAGNLSRHQAAMHGSLRVRTLASHKPGLLLCPTCDSKFDDHASFQEHIKAFGHDRHAANESSIPVTATDLQSDGFFTRPERLLRNCVEHSTNLSSKARIVEDGCLRPAPNEAVFRTFDVCGFLSRLSAPPCVFFDTTPGESSLDFNRITSFPVASEPDELLAKLALNVNDLFSQGGDVRLFFAGLISAQRKGPSFLSPRVRAVVVLAKAEDSEAMRIIGALEMNPLNNALFFKDDDGESPPGQPGENASEEPSWSLATSVNYQGRSCRLSVIFAIPRSVRTDECDSMWLDVSRVNQRNSMPICPLCRSSFSSLQNLEDHIQVEHEQRRFVCKHLLSPEDRDGVACSKTFQTRQGLENHVQNIHEAREFPCPECPKVFRKLTSLTSHRNGVHGDNKVACSDCDETFRWRVQLSRHRKRVHLMNP